MKSLIVRLLGVLCLADPTSINEQEMLRAMAGHAAVAPQIQALGGQIVAHYQDAINGMRVLIDPSRLDALKNIPGVVSVSRIPLYQPVNSNGVPLISAPGACW